MAAASGAESKIEFLSNLAENVYKKREDELGEEIMREIAEEMRPVIALEVALLKFGHDGHNAVIKDRRSARLAASA